MMTSGRQKAKNGARLASLADNPANLSKNPTLLETSLGPKNAGWPAHEASLPA